MRPEFSDTAAVPAIVEALFATAFPGDQPHPSALVRVNSMGSVDVELNGDESPLFRVVALAVLAAELGDEDGPEAIPGGERYTCGTWRDVFFLIRTPISAEQQAELERLGRRLVDEIDGI